MLNYGSEPYTKKIRFLALLGGNERVAEMPSLGPRRESAWCAYIKSDSVIRTCLDTRAKQRCDCFTYVLPAGRPPLHTITLCSMSRKPRAFDACVHLLNHLTAHRWDGAGSLCSCLRLQCGTSHQCRRWCCACCTGTYFHSLWKSRCAQLCALSTRCTSVKLGA